MTKRIDRLEQTLAERVAQKEREQPVPPVPPVTAPLLAVADPVDHLSASPQRFLSISSSGVPAPLPGASFGKLHFAGYYLGEISSYSGIPLFSSAGQSWIQSRTGETGTFPKLVTLPWQNQHYAHEALFSAASAIALPDRSIVEDYYFTVYCSTPLSSVFPVVDLESFNATIELAYDKISPGSTAARACVFSFLSVMPLFEATLGGIPVDSDACASEAFRLMFPTLMLEASIIGLQTALMQVCAPAWYSLSTINNSVHVSSFLR